MTYAQDQAAIRRARSRWNYTAAEKRTIETAFHAIARVCESNHSMDRDFEDGFKQERRERSESTVAKALMVECFGQGLEADFKSGREALDRAYYLAPGCRLAYLIGAAALDRYPERITDELRAAISAANEAHSERQRRGVQNALAS